MKKLKALSFAILMALVLVCAAFMPLGCTPKNETANSKYVLEAVYDADNKRVDATLTLEYVNKTDVELKDLKFHLYARAYREGAQFSPIEPGQKQKAYPGGMSYGDMTIFSVKRDGRNMDVAIAGQDEDILSVDGKLAPTASTRIEIEFRVQLATVRHRLGWFDGVANLGNWYPVACMYREGAFDTSPYYYNGDPFFSEVSDYEMTFTTPAGLTVATSGAQQVKMSGGKKITTAKIRNSRDAAAVISDFNVVSDTRDGVAVNYYYKSDDDPRAALNTAFDSLKTFGQLYGSYVYDTLSVVKTPFLHGGMEYPALVYISDTLGDSLFTEVIIHETAHQWWYAAVGSDQVREAWLDEAMAEYSTTVFYEKNPAYEVTRAARIGDSWKGYILFCDLFKENGKGDTSMNRKVFEYAIPDEYTIMTYVKGQLMLDTLRDSIGDKAFFGALKAYYAAHKFGIATGAHFIAAMEDASKTLLKSFFDSWLKGKMVSPAS